MMPTHRPTRTKASPVRALSLILLCAGPCDGLRPGGKPSEMTSRRGILRLGAASAIAATAIGPLDVRAYSVEQQQPPVQSSAALDELPRNTVIAYQRTWPAMQLAADFYAFELLDRVRNPQRWDLIGAFIGIGGDSSASRLEREFLSPMTILALAFPPDAGGDEMQESLLAFRQSMGQLGKVAGSSPGLSEGPSTAEKALAMTQWEGGRVALNRFLLALNAATETSRLTTIPTGGVGYPRSKERYVQLTKDAALCRNRGGEQLAGLWGNLMVYGTVPGVNPCGNAAQAYYSQGI